MKTITSLKFIASLITIIAFGLVLKSCKKVDNNAGLTDKETEAAKATIIKSLKERYGELGAVTSYSIEQPATDLSYKNAAGKMVKINTGLSTNAAVSPNGVDPCLYNCSNTTDPNKLKHTYTISSIQRTYYCQPNALNAQNDIVVTWQISVPYTPLVADPNNPANLSSGSIVVTPPLGPYWGNGNITPVTISKIGADPSCTGHNIYKVSYNFQSVSRDQFFDNGYPVTVSLTLYNDCGLVGNVVNTGTLTFSLAGKTAPCDRTDHVWINPGGGPGGCATAAGTYISGCSVAPGMIPTDLNQLEYRQVNAVTGNLGWEEQTSQVKYGQIPFTTTFTASFNATSGFVYLLSMVPGTGTWLVRYRNIKTGSCNLIGNQNTPPPPYLLWPGNWVVEVWPL